MEVELNKQSQQSLWIISEYKIDGSSVFQNLEGSIRFFVKQDEFLASAYLRAQRALARATPPAPAPQPARRRSAPRASVDGWRRLSGAGGRGQGMGN
jgi:hypothetical protein